MTLLVIIIILGVIIGAYMGYDCSWTIADGIMGGFVGAWLGFIIGIMLSCIVSDIGYNATAQKVTSQERYEMAANGHYTLNDGELNFGYIDKNGDFQAVDVDDNFNIKEAATGETPYVEVLYYETTNKTLASCSLGMADKGTVYNIYVPNNKEAATDGQ